MLVSVSRRTDILAFYAPWFMHRVREGFCLVGSPFDARHYSRVSLVPRDAELLVFWTKNPLPLMPYLDELDARGYAYYFTFTLTPYGRDVEPGFPEEAARLDAFARLSQRLGPDRVDWRYDPILLDGAHPPAWHEEQFGRLLAHLVPLTTRCIVSFADPYRHLGGRVAPAPPEDMRLLAAALSRAAAPCGLPLFTCGEQMDLSDLGVQHAACVDPQKAARILGCPVDATRDKGQRPACHCAGSVDIGAYSTCPGGCAYCYATHSRSLALKRYQAHDPALPALTGPLPPGARVTNRAMRSVRRAQTSLLL